MNRLRYSILCMVLIGLNAGLSFGELPDTPAVRGMITKVHHLVRIVDEK